jgi:hypothetical protein
MSTNQPRKPAGTPAGGQWASAQHDEADIELGPTTARERGDKRRSAGGTVVELTDGTRMWYRDGKRHRTDGPGVE